MILDCISNSAATLPQNVSAFCSVTRCETSTQRSERRGPSPGLKLLPLGLRDIMPWRMKEVRDEKGREGGWEGV